MQTFLPYEVYADSAKTLDPIRLNSQRNEALILLKSLTKVYPPRKNGKSGWEDHTVAKFWSGHELQLTRYLLAICKEHRKREPKTNKAKAFRLRQERVDLFTSLIAELQALNWPDDPPSLIGDEKFHSGFRSLLLFKDIQGVTYKKWKNGEYPDHVCTRDLPAKKYSWKKKYYLNIWNYFDRPEPVWYNQWGWDEEPDDMQFYYNVDLIPQMKKEEKRKEERPYSKAAWKLINAATKAKKYG